MHAVYRPSWHRASVNRGANLIGRRCPSLDKKNISAETSEGKTLRKYNQEESRPTSRKLLENQILIEYYPWKPVVSA